MITGKPKRQQQRPFYAKKKDNKRIKNQLEYYKKAWRKAENEITKLKQPALLTHDKTTLIFLALQLFLVARISFRAVARVLSVLAPSLGLTKPPCAQTIINWVTRLTISRMKDTPTLFPKGFILIVDASIGLGKGKIMSVLALDAEHFLQHPNAAPSLGHVHCVAVSVADTWTGDTVAELLEEVIAQIGVPLAYLKDGGTDLGKAVRLLNEKGLSSCSIDDISHFIANLLKHEYQNHPLFDVFISACGKVSKMLKQTLLACLAPPKTAIKARFMNVHRLVQWASYLLGHSSKGRAKKGSLLQKLRNRFDRLPECKTFITDFLSDVEPLMECQEILKNNGLSQDSVARCRPIVERIPSNYIRDGFNDWLDRHLAMSHRLGLHSCGLPISSDCIESLFGIAKRHGTGEIKDANRIALRIPALCGELTWRDAENVRLITVKEQQAWIGSSPSLIKQRRDVLKHSGSLEKISENDAGQNIKLIGGSKTGEKPP